MISDQVLFRLSPTVACNTAVNCLIMLPVFPLGGCETAECFLRHAMNTNHKRTTLNELSQNIRATTIPPQPREPFKEFTHMLKFWKVIKFRCYRLVIEWSHGFSLQRPDFSWKSGLVSKQLVVSSHPQVSFFVRAISIACHLGKPVMSMSFLKVKHQHYCTMFHKVSVFVSCERRDYDHR